MDYNNFELTRVQSVVLAQEEGHVQELSDIQLALVGGGCGEMIAG